MKPSQPRFSFQKRTAVTKEYGHAFVPSLYRKSVDRNDHLACAHIVIFCAAVFNKNHSGYESMLKGLVKKYNKQHKPEEALPNITPHTLRHTFCTRLANAGMNPKALQYIMGHSNITMTLNYYAHATFASAKAEMDRLAA